MTDSTNGLSGGLVFILDSLREGITLSDQSGQFEIFNSEMERLTGYSREEANKSGDFSVLLYPDPENRKKALGMLGDITFGSKYGTETRIMTKTGDPRDVIVSTTVVSYGGRNMFLSAYHDITRLKSAEAELEKRLRREEMVERVSSYFVHSEDLDETLNASLKEIGEGMDASRAYIIKVHDEGRLLSITHEWVREGVAPQMLILKDKPTASMAWLIDQLAVNKVINYSNTEEIPDEQIKQMLRPRSAKAILAVPIYLENRLFGFIGLDESRGNRVWHDENVALIKTFSEIISMGIHRKEDERELQDAKSGLELKVATKTKDLQKALDAVKESDKMKDDFLAITSHELKTPLTSIILYTELLQQCLKGINRSEREYLDTIHSESLHLRALILDILELAKLDARQKVLNKVPARIKDVINESVAEVESIAKAKKIKIKVKCHKDLPEVIIDKPSIYRVINNLLSNALKFSKAKTKVMVNATRKGGYILVSVKDEGVGISKKNQKRIFDRFFQVENTLSRQHGGTGLGLAICKGNVEAHGGRIWVKSKLNGGSVFYFTIPITKM